MEIAKLYKEAGKSRRRDSIFRPYQVSEIFIILI